MAALYWLTGLAGAGKSSIGRELFAMIRQRNSNAVFLDGDTLRTVLGAGEGDFTKERRLALAFTYARLCKMLIDQEVHVVCATISMFHSVRDWLRTNVVEYREIYVRVPFDVLLERDQKGLYSRAQRRETTNVLGMDQQFEEPLRPDLVLEHSPESTPTDGALRIFERFVGPASSIDGGESRKKES